MENPTETVESNDCVSHFEHERHRDSYMKTFQIDHVLELASSHNDGKRCSEFRVRECGSFHVCFFVEFPSDGPKWIVRFPICPVVYEPWQKLQGEIAAMEYIKQKTTIPIPRVYGYGPGGELDLNNATGRPYVILEYIDGQKFDPKRLLKAPREVTTKFYAQLGDILSQLRAQEFEYAGSPSKDSKGQFTVTSPRSPDLNCLQLQGKRINVSRQQAASDFANCHYKTLTQRLALPTEDYDKDEAQYEVEHEIFAVEDFKIRLPDLLDPSLNLGPFVLTHGDLQPRNIIVNENFEIQGIIDWEWSTIVPRQFFMPPLWVGDYEGVYRGDDRSPYSMLYEALSSATSVLASEWGPHSSSSRLFIPGTLLHHDAFTYYYLAAFFPEGRKRREKIEEFKNQQPFAKGWQKRWTNARDIRRS